MGKIPLRWKNHSLFRMRCAKIRPKSSYPRRIERQFPRIPGMMRKKWAHIRSSGAGGCGPAAEKPLKAKIRDEFLREKRSDRVPACAKSV
jgi:hypothetical protein